MDFDNNVNGKYSTIVSQKLSGPSGFAITGDQYFLQWFIDILLHNFPFIGETAPLHAH